MDFKVTKVQKAFMLTPETTSINANHQAALSQISCLIKACNFELTVANTLPDEQHIKDHDIYFIDLFHHNNIRNLPDRVHKLSQQTKVALFNVQNSQLCEKSLLLNGIEGIFYVQDSPDNILKGLNSLTKNERWFKYSVMNHAVAHLLKLNKTVTPQVDNSLSKTQYPNLTKRENTIINLVTKGAQNQEIADQLNISTNTVKTHVYSIFRKTQSRNRIELITWSLQFLAPNRFDATVN